MLYLFDKAPSRYLQIKRKFDSMYYFYLFLSNVDSVNSVIYLALFLELLYNVQ